MQVEELLTLKVFSHLLQFTEYKTMFQFHMYYIRLVSIFQIYNEYVQATDSLELEKVENQRLNNYLDQILQVCWKSGWIYNIVSLCCFCHAVSIISKT